MSNGPKFFQTGMGKRLSRAADRLVEIEERREERNHPIPYTLTPEGRAALGREPT